MKSFLAILLTLALSLASADSPAPLSSPSGKFHLRLSDPTSLPGSTTPAENEDADATQTLLLSEKGRAPFTITVPEGRCTPHWSVAESYLALAIQTDRANFSLLILRLSDRKSITCDFTALGQQMLQLFEKAGLDDATAALQLCNVRCTPQQCTGTLVSGTAQHTGTLTFAIDFSQHEWTTQGTLIQPRLTATELKFKE